MQLFANATQIVFAEKGQISKDDIDRLLTLNIVVIECKDVEAVRYGGSTEAKLITDCAQNRS